MKKIMLSFFALAIAVSFSTSAFAKSGLSVSLGVGLKADLNGLGGTITDDGLDGALEHALWEKAIIDEKTLLVLEEKGVIKDLETNGAMSGLDFAIGVRYDFLDKFFAKVGFNYTMKIMGGETSWKYDTVAAAGLGNALSGNGGPGNLIFDNVYSAVLGYEASQTFESSAWGVPVLFGINLPALDGKVNFYFGIGVCVSSAKWSVEIQTLDLMFDPANNFDVANDDAESTEKVEFNYIGVAPMYSFGVDAEVAAGVSVFIEYEVVLGMGYSDVETLETAVGTSALGSDQLAYPVVTGGSIIRFGASYKLPIL